jgi:hypothetical protein
MNSYGRAPSKDHRLLLNWTTVPCFQYRHLLWCLLAYYVTQMILFGWIILYPFVLNCGLETAPSYVWAVCDGWNGCDIIIVSGYPVLITAAFRQSKEVNFVFNYRWDRCLNRAKIGNFGNQCCWCPRWTPCPGVKAPLDPVLMRALLAA